MLYLYSEDDFYYSKKGTTDLLTKFPHINEIITFPSLQDLKKKKEEDLSKIAFLAPYLPEKIGEEFKDNLFFEILFLPNKTKDGILTSGQEREGKSVAEVLSQKLGVSMFYSENTMADYGGVKELHEQVDMIDEKFEHGVPTKGFFIAGIPGTGKSFLVKCIAGELGYILVRLNLSKFKNMDNGVAALEKFFEFFNKQKGKFVLWIDEIEKMLIGEESQEIIGEFLTSVNDSNIKGASSFFVMATANNIEKLTKSNVELFRTGRFDLVVFIKNPKKDDAQEIFNIYIKKQRETVIETIIPNAIYALAKRTVEKRKALKHNAEISDTKKHIKIKKIKKHRAYYAATSFFKSADPKYTLDKITNEERHVFIGKILSDEKSKQLIENIAVEYMFKFDVKTYMRLSFDEYRKETSQRDRFPYTPAEIEFIITDSFNRYFLKVDETGELEYLIKRYKPLQVSVSDSIKKMLGQAANFLEV